MTVAVSIAETFKQVAADIKKLFSSKKDKEKVYHFYDGGILNVKEDAIIFTDHHITIDNNVNFTDGQKVVIMNASDDVINITCDEVNLYIQVDEGGVATLYHSTKEGWFATGDITIT